MEIGPPAGELENNRIACGEGRESQARGCGAIMENRGGEKRQDGHAHAHIDPPVGEVGGQHRAEGSIAPSFLQAHGRQFRGGGLGVVDPRHLPPDNESSEHHADAVDEKWPAEAQEGQAGAEDRASDIAQ